MKQKTGFDIYTEFVIEIVINNKLTPQQKKKAITKCSKDFIKLRDEYNKILDRFKEKTTKSFYKKVTQLAIQNRRD